MVLYSFASFGHGVKVATGKYDDPEDAGDVSHFQALTTALSATVGIGNIAGVALAHPLGRSRCDILDVDYSSSGYVYQVH